MKKITLFSLFLAAFLLLTACNPAAEVDPTAAPTQIPTDPTAKPPSSAGETLDALQPGDILVQYDYLPGFTRPEVHNPFGRVPFFTLYVDGTAIYVQEGATYESEVVMLAQLSREETLALYQQVLDAGFESLVSDTSESQCEPVEGSEEMLCVSVVDASTTIFRAQVPGSGLREIQIYADFANEPQAFERIQSLLGRYTHAGATSYRPENATIFISPLQEAVGVEILEWPLDPAILTGMGIGFGHMTAMALSGDDLTNYLAAVPRNTGDAFFSLDGRDYNVFLVPWMPGADHHAAIAEAFPPVEGGDESQAICAVLEPPALGPYRLAYLSAGDVWVWTEFGEVISLTGTGDATQVRITPDGSTVVYARAIAGGGAELWAADGDGANPRLLAGGPEMSGRIEIHDFSADNTLVAFTHMLDEKAGELWSARTDGAGALRLVDQETLMAIVAEPLADFAVPTGVTWFPGESRLAFDAAPRFENDGIYIYVQRQNWVVDALSGQQGELFSAGEGGSLSFSPDGRSAAITTPDSLRLMNVEENRPFAADFPYFAVGMGEFYAFPPMRWTHDSHGLLVAQPQSEEMMVQDAPIKIWYVPVDGSPAVELVEVSGWFTSLQFSLGMSIDFDPSTSWVGLWRGISVGSNERELLLYSLDGKHRLAYASGDLLDFLGWSPNGRHFAYVVGSGQESYVGDVCGGPRELGRGFYPGNLRWVDVLRMFYERWYEGGRFELYRFDGEATLVLNLEDSGGYDIGLLPAE